VALNCLGCADFSYVLAAITYPSYLRLCCLRPDVCLQPPMEAQFTFMADAYYCTFMIICTNLLIWMWVSRHLCRCGRWCRYRRRHTRRLPVLDHWAGGQVWPNASMLVQQCCLLVKRVAFTSPLVM